MSTEQYKQNSTSWPFARSKTRRSNFNPVNYLCIICLPWRLSPHSRQQCKLELYKDPTVPSAWSSTGPTRCLHLSRGWWQLPLTWTNKTTCPSAATPARYGTSLPWVYLMCSTCHRHDTEVHTKNLPEATNAHFIAIYQWYMDNDNEIWLYVIRASTSYWGEPVWRR